MKKVRVLFFVMFLTLCFVFINISHIKASTYMTDDKIEVQGAKIRTTGNAGIRFVASINDYDVTGVTKYGLCLAYGIAKADEEFVIDGTVNGKSVINAAVNSTNEGLFYVTLYNIPENQYGQLVSARAYVIDNEQIVYSSTVTVRSLGQVALMALSNDESNDYLNHISTVIDKMYTDVNVTFDSKDVSFSVTAEDITDTPEYTLSLDTYKNALDGSITYIADSQYLTSDSNKSSFIFSNKALLKYDENYKAYKIVAKAVSSSSGPAIKYFDVDWDYAILYMSTEELNSLEIGQYVVFDSELSLGMGPFNANIYNIDAFYTNSKTFKVPEVFPTVYNKENIANTGWVSSVDNELYTYYPGYNGNIFDITYTPVWYYDVNVTLDYAGNLGFKTRSTMVREFVNDFNAYAGKSAAIDGSDFFSATYSQDNSIAYNFFTNVTYANKWSWLLEYINSVRANNSKKPLSITDLQGYVRGELHNFLNASATSTYGCDYSSESVANGYLDLDVFKVENVVYTYETVLPTPTRDGYEFLGWVSSLDEQIYTVFPAFTTNVGSITYQAKWKAIDVVDLGSAFDCVSDNVTSNTIDNLLSEYEGYTLEFTSSNNDLYTIKDGKGYTSRTSQTHKAQIVTVTLKATLGTETRIMTKDITIDPVLFDDMANPKAVYFAVSSTSSYKNNSERYKEEGTLFSEKFRENMDMIYYSFAVPQTNGTLTINTTYINDVIALKNDGIRVLLVIDGANKSSLQAMVKLCDTDETRAIFVGNIIDLVNKYNFDGVDIDWEFPGVSGLDSYYSTERDQMNLNKLLRDLRTALDANQDPNGSPYILSAAIPASSWGSARYDFTGSASKVLANDPTLGGIDTYCDYVNMMSYDLNHETYTTHIASCYSSTAAHDYKFGCVYGAQRFISLGLSKEKIILGSAAYGKAYAITGTVDENAQYPALGVEAKLTQISGISGSYASGTIYYTAIKSLLERDDYTLYNEYNNGNIVGSYLYSKTNGIFVTFDSVEAIKAKCEYAKENGYGIMVWAYGEDATDTLIHTICDNL